MATSRSLGSSNRTAGRRHGGALPSYARSTRSSRLGDSAAVGAVGLHVSTISCHEKRSDRQGYAIAKVCRPCAPARVASLFVGTRIRVNPVRDVAPLETQGGGSRALTVDECQRWLAAGRQRYARRKDLPDLARFLCWDRAVGLVKRSECIGKDVDLERRQVLHVSRTVIRVPSRDLSPRGRSQGPASGRSACRCGWWHASSERRGRSVATVHRSSRTRSAAIATATTSSGTSGWCEKGTSSTGSCRTPTARPWPLSSRPGGQCEDDRRPARPLDASP